MSEHALKLIIDNIEKHRKGEDARFLDLGNCGLTEVPDAIGECTWLEELVLANESYSRDSEKWVRRKSVNAGLLNNITQLSNGISKLINLKKLFIQGQFDKVFDLSDLSPIATLNNLEFLDLNFTNVTDLLPLAKLKNIQALSFGSTMVSDLSYLRGLNNLQDLFCGRTQISDLSPLSGLVNLQTLFCFSTQVSDLSPLGTLKNLKTLFAYETKILEISPIVTLVNLVELNISHTKVSNLTPLIELDNLKTVVIGETEVIDFTPLIKLKNLEELFIYSLPIKDISFLQNMRKLKHLSAFRTQICDLSILSDLMELHSIYISHTQVSDISPLIKLKKLQRLGISNTLVSDLSPLAGLEYLEQLELENTDVSDLTPILSLIIEKLIPVRQSRYDLIGEDDQDWHEKPFISVEGCPLIIPPIEFAQHSPQTVCDYFEELGDDNLKLNEVKIIFLGEASAGKTSLVRRLLGEDFDNKESQTHGIRIKTAPFVMTNNDIVTAHLWDFGGQEVMHATHQFFLSQRCIYVLLLNSRNDDQAEKWLKHSASFGGHSPVLVVLNKIDENPSFEVNRKTLVEKYPQIRGFYRLSAKTNKGLEEFKEALRQEIDKADTRRTPFPIHWLGVKEYFSNMEADYIESAEYLKVCEQNNVTRQFSQDVLLQFLHDLGIVINFRGLKNFDTQILNPLWLTNGVYRIINSEIVANAGGLLREADFNDVINDPRYRKENTTDRAFEYTKNKLLYIVRVMQEFELCFLLDERTFVVPQLLPISEPDFKIDGAVLRFIIHFPDFLPDSIFPRLMVKLHTFITGDQRWRRGFVMYKPSVFQAVARVRWDKEDQKILVDVCGEDRRRFLSFIRETVKEIVGDFVKLNVEEMVPIPEIDDFFEYQYLVEAEKAGEKDVFVKQLRKRIPIADMLDGVEESNMRDEIEQLPVRAFISYSHKDLEYLKELRTALAPLIRLQKLQIWDDRDIDAGEAWEKVIFQQLEEADIVLCLVSADFVASDFCYKKEFNLALEAHRKGEKTIIPVMLRKTDWQDLPLAEIQGTPGEWITTAANKDVAWAKVSESLRSVLTPAKKRKKALLDIHLRS